MHQTINVLQQLRVFGFDDHEAIAALRSAANAGGSRQTETRTYELLSEQDAIAKVHYNSNLVLSSIDVRVDVWQASQARIEADAKVNRTRIARSVLFSYRSVEGFARVPDWLQLRPVACALEDRTGFGAFTDDSAVAVPRPFALEVVYRYSDLPFLEVHRRIRAVQEATWLLSAFLDVAVFSLRNPYSWAFWEGSYHLVECSMEHGLDQASQVEFSDVQMLPELSLVQNSQYFSELGITTAEFRVPDLNILHAKYIELSPEKKVRFLRSCASLFTACEPTLGVSQRVVTLVSAIEPLLDEGEICDVCGSKVGITRQFRKFLDDYVKPSSTVRRFYEDIYDARSNQVHGNWNFDVDEAFLGLHQPSRIVSLVAWRAAKRGVVEWLLNQ